MLIWLICLVGLDQFDIKSLIVLSITFILTSFKHKWNLNYFVLRNKINFLIHLYAVNKKMSNNHMHSNWWKDERWVQYYVLWNEQRLGSKNGRYTWYKSYILEVVWQLNGLLSVTRQGWTGVLGQRSRKQKQTPESGWGGETTRPSLWNTCVDQVFPSRPVLCHFTCQRETG